MRRIAFACLALAFVAGPARSLPSVNGCTVVTTGAPGLPTVCDYTSSGGVTRYAAAATGWDITISNPDGTSSSVSEGPYDVTPEIQAHTGEVYAKPGAHVHASVHCAGSFCMRQNGWISVYTSPNGFDQPSIVTIVGSGSSSFYFPGALGLQTTFPLETYRGETLTLMNRSLGSAHSFTSDAVIFWDPSQHIFDSGPVEPGASIVIPGIEALLPGLYGFHCSVHPSAMKGFLRIY